MLVCLAADIMEHVCQWHLVFKVSLESGALGRTQTPDSTTETELNLTDP